MIFCFSGTGNSRYIAQRIAEALQEPMIDLNARIKANVTTTVDTGSRCHHGDTDLCMAYSQNCFGMDGENKVDRCEAYLVCDGLWQ